MSALKETSGPVAMRDVTPLDTPDQPGVLGMIERLACNGATIDVIERLLDVQHRHEQALAKKAYAAAMSKAHGEFKSFVKSKSGYGNRYQYETLDSVLAAVRPALTAHGFAIDWETRGLVDGLIEVTCVITHEDGFERRNSLTGDPKTVADAKANMNSVQRLGAVCTYLQRYTLKAALGLASSDDTDAQGGDDYDTSPWTERISLANDMQALDAIGEDIRSANDIPAQALALIRNAWVQQTRRVKSQLNGSE
jgi:hypothetical protein